ncbi:hypothetical protein KEM52_005149 [Ascosphaera acerosa]|nr:hypothetical protein KEM52_005149 [Ascosphaera acerosa]
MTRRRRGRGAGSTEINILPTRPLVDATMLRRAPTAITVTAEDIIAFEEDYERRQAELAAKRQQELAQQENNLAAAAAAGTAAGGSVKAGGKTSKQQQQQQQGGSRAADQGARTREQRIGYTRRA